MSQGSFSARAAGGAATRPEQHFRPPHQKRSKIDEDEKHLLPSHEAQRTLRQSSGNFLGLLGTPAARPARGIGSGSNVGTEMKRYATVLVRIKMTDLRALACKPEGVCMPKRIFLGFMGPHAPQLRRDYS